MGSYVLKSICFTHRNKVCTKYTSDNEKGQLNSIQTELNSIQT
jgi:hypothetical protein